MSLKTYNIDVPITPGVMPPVIHIGQYDSGREYIAHLKNDDGTDYTIPANSTATFTGCNPRKEVFEIEATVGETTVTFQPSDEATSMWGKYGATINITSGGEKMSPIVLLMDVQKAGATDEEIAGAANFPDAVTTAVDNFLTEALEEGDLGSLYVTKAAQIPATSGMTQPVGITPEGQLVTTPGGGGEASVTPASIVTATGQMTTAQKTSTRSNINAAPSTNIQKSALASAVQTSLGKADTAYQKPSGGIPAADMASAVQTALTAAGTAVQPSALSAYILRSAQGSKGVNDTQEVHVDPNGKLWTQPGGDGGGSTPTVIENTKLITMTYAAGDTYADMTAAQIYDEIENGPVNLVLIDRAGRQCALIAPPEESGGSYTAARFFTLDDSGVELIVYSVSSTGTVSSTTIPIPEDSGGGAENAVLYVSQSLTTAQKAQARTNIGAGTGSYSKPSSGIPKTDLASAVQTSLNNADSAYQKPLTGISEADLAAESVVISPDTEHAGQYVSTRTYAQIAQASSDGFAIKPEFWPDNNTTIRGAVLDISSTASVFAFLDTRSTPTIYVFTVEAQGVSVDSFAVGGGSGPAIPTPTSSDNGKYLGVVNGAYALRSAPSGGGVTIYAVDAVYESGYWFIRHDGLDIAAEDIFTALSDGNLVRFTDDAGAEGDLMEIDYESPGTGRLLYKTSNMDNGAPGWRLFEIADTIVQGSPRADVTMTPVELLPVSDSRTASTVASGFTVEGNRVYTVSGTVSGFTLITSTLPTMLAGQCIEIRLTTGSSAITTPTWPSWAHFMNGWDGKFEASTYYDVLIDDVGNVYAGTREVS